MPIEEYNIELNLTDAPPAKYKYPVGNRVPLREPPKQENFTSYFSALAAGTIPHRVGVASAVYTDRIMRSFDQNDNFDNVDPSFDSFEAWKSGKHSPEEFEKIGPMKNWEQYSFYVTMRDFEKNNLERLEQSGVTGNVAALLAQIATDPTTYAGFGAAQMLSKGMAAKTAYGLSAAGAGVAYEALQQGTDVADSRSATESLTTVAAAGVMGSLLGKAVDVWGSRKAAGALKATEGKDFYESSMQYVDDAATIEQRARSLGAAAVIKDPEMSKIAGTFARNVSYGLRRLAPRLLTQTASEDVSRVTGEKFFGRTLRTQGDVAGEQRIISFRDNLDVDTAKYLGKTEKMHDAIKQYRQSGGIVDEEAMRQAILRVDDLADNLSDDSASALIARANRDFFEGMAKEAEGIPGFNYRKGYTPMMFNRNAIKQNFDAFSKKFVAMFQRAKTGLADDLSDASNRMTNMIKNKAAQVDIDGLQEEINLIKQLIDTPDADLADEATLYASKFASGQIGAKETLNPFLSKQLPSNFKQRLFNVRDFIDFIEVNPYKLQVSYRREVMPFIASYKTFGERTPEKALEAYRETMQQKISDALKAGNQKLASKLEREREDIVGAIRRGWDDVTGGTITKAGDVIGGPAMNIITAVKNWIAASSLGGIIFASLIEPAAITITNGLKHLPGFGRLLTQMATSPEVRELARKDAYYLSNAMSTGVHYHLMNNFADEMANMEIAGSGITGKIAKASQTVNGYSQIANGNVPFTSVIRTALTVAQQGVLRESLEQLAAGTIKDARKADLAFLGISTDEQARRILKYAKQYGEEIEGNFTFNLDKWGDSPSRRLIEIALVRDNMRTSQNPGIGDVPHIFHVPGANLFTQFKSWGVMATHNYGISALQRADAESLMNVTAYIGISSAAYMLAEVARGNPPPTDLDEIIYSGVTNSGLVGVLPDYGGHWLMNTLLDLESGGAKFAERQDILSTALGPIGTKAQDVQGSILRPLGQAIDPNKDVQFDDTWAKNMLDILPLPFVKPFIKNEILTED